MCEGVNGKHCRSLKLVYVLTIYLYDSVIYFIYVSDMYQREINIPTDELENSSFIAMAMILRKMTIGPITVLLITVIAQSLIFSKGNFPVNIPDRACEVYSQSGSVIIGGIFPIYRTVGSVPCDGTYWVSLISLAESMRYAIRLVNERQDILPNVTLGFSIRNNCGEEDVTVWTMTTMVSPLAGTDYNNWCDGYQQEDPAKIIGVVGTTRSSTSYLAAKVATVYNIPLVSYWATSDELSDTRRFPTFFRTIPPDKFQVQAIIDLLLHFEWKYIALFYSVDPYGLHGARQIWTLAEESDLCIAVNLPVSNNPSKSELKGIADKLFENDKITVIVIFSLVEAANMVQRAIMEYNINRKFTFIGSDGWGGDLYNDEDTQELLHGSLFIRLFEQPNKDFRKYYRQLPNNQHLASRWYRELLQIIKEEHNCTDWDSCPIPDAYNEIAVMNSVFALATALHDSIRSNCHSDFFCEEAIHGNTYLDHLRNVSFNGPGGRFRFDKNGDTSGKYQIKSWQLDHGVYKMVDVGFWDPEKPVDHLQVDKDIIQWNGMTGLVPISLCVDTCAPNEIAVPLKKKCCWGCQRCPGHAIIVKDSCEECPLFEWPSNNFTQCIPIYPDYVDIPNPIVLANLVVSSFGILLCVSAFLGISVYRHHKLIKAASIELSCVNLTGLTMACLASLSTILRPSSVSCRVSECLISLSFSLIFAPILMKVNRIWRIFQASGNSVQHPRFVKPKEILAITGTIVLIQVHYINHSKCM